MIAVSKIEVKKEDGAGTYRRYVVTVGNNRPCYDITKELEAADKEDKSSSYDREKGFAFGFTIHHALRAMELHEEVEKLWEKAGAPEEDKPKVAFPGFWTTIPKDKMAVSKTWSW